LLVGFKTSDDAGVYRLTDELALVTTADFITPPVDDPYLFGQIAAANALSDIYAMGGRPLTCLNLAAFPSNKLPLTVLHQIVAGALSKITEAGAVLAGGHTIEDDEPKFGLAVNGLVHPERYWSNSTARPGDALVLTKPVGSGVLFNANLKGLVSAAAMETCHDHLTTLNRAACEVMQNFRISAATDITGFGLAGHADEMARGAGVTLALSMDHLPILPEALDMYRRGVTTGVNAHNRKMVQGGIGFENDWPDWQREIVFDPQTSGGLLVAVDAEQADALVEALHKAGVGSACRIGTVASMDDKIRLRLV
jgi:selenide,water dikinase